MLKTLRNYNAVFRTMIQKEKENPPRRRSNHATTNSQKRAAVRIERHLRKEASKNQKTREASNEERRGRILKKIKSHRSKLNDKKSRKISKQGTNI